MKTKWINLSSLSMVVMALSFFMVSCEKDSFDQYTGETTGEFTAFYDTDPGAPSTPESNAGITPYIIAGQNPGGNRTCEEVAAAFGATFDYTTDKLDYENGEFNGDWPAGLTVTVTNGTYVSFSLTDPFKIDDKCYLIAAVIVKGSDDANVYFYEDGIQSDSGLASPVNASGNPAGLSNLTFCLIEVECPAEEECWAEETAFGGDTAGEGAAWWFAFDAEGDAVQSIYAGQKKVEGASVEYDSENDIITIVLGPNMKLQPVTETTSVHPRTGAVTTKVDDEQVKVQGYDDLPGSRPAAGRFTLYKGRDLVINGDGSRYYVIHLDVEVEVDCEE